jgi:high-affinity iron transporter
MAKEVFSVPIFIIVFRETLEAAIIVSVLLSLIEQLVTGSTSPPATPPSEATRNSDADSKDVIETRLPTTLVEDDSIQRRRLLRKMRIQVNHFSAPTSWPYR